MAIEIVNFPSSMVIFHSYVNVYQRVNDGTVGLVCHVGRFPQQDVLVLFSSRSKQLVKHNNDDGNNVSCYRINIVIGTDVNDLQIFAVYLKPMPLL